MNRAIVLSCHVIGLAVIRALGVMNVPITAVYYDKNDMGYVSRYANERLYVPDPVKAEDEFLKALLAYGEKRGGGVLFPVDDPTLKAVSENKQLLGKYFVVACPDRETALRYLDKKLTYEIAAQAGIPVPKTLAPDSPHELTEFADYIGYPCLLKPSESHLYFQRFGKKLLKVENGKQLLAAYEQAQAAEIDVMVQEYIPGDVTNGVNYNSYFWGNEAAAEFTAQKVRYAPSEFGVPRVVVSKNVPEVIELGRTVLRSIGFYGFSCTEFKMDARDGIYKLMEVNGRHNRSGLLALRCGINFPWIEYNHLVNGELATRQAFSSGIYWIDEMSDIVNSIKQRTKEKYSLNQLLRPYCSKHVFAVSDPRDIKPSIKRAADLALKFCKSSLKF